MRKFSDQVRAKIQTTLHEAVEAKKAPALIYGATSSKELLFCESAGVEEIGESRRADSNSVLWLCSQTKMITSIAVLQLIERGMLTLETHAVDIIPELQNAVVLDDHTQFGSAAAALTYKPAKTPISIRHLLNHTSGLFYEEIKGKEDQPGLPYTSKHDRDDPIGNWFKVLKGGLPGVPLKFEPGTSFAYGYSTDVLGFVVERVSGKSLEEYFKEYIFVPLGMRSTSFYLTPDLWSRMMTICLRTPEGENVPLDETEHFPILERNPENVRLHFGGDGLFSTAKDYLVLLRHLLQILDETADAPILTCSSLTLLFEPSLNVDGAKALDEMFYSSGLQFGLGLAIQTQDRGPGKRKAGSGWWGGWSGTFHFLDPQTGIAAFAGSQLAPPPQMEVIGVFDQVQTIVYSASGDANDA